MMLVPYRDFGGGARENRRVSEAFPITLIFLLSHQRSGSHFLKGALGCHNEQLDIDKSDATRLLVLPEVFTKGITAKGGYMADWVFGPFHDKLLAADPWRWGKPDGIAEASGMYLDMLQEKAEGIQALVDVKLNQLYIGEGWYHQTSATPRMIHKLARMGKIVFLRRRNLVRTIVSGLQAKKVGVWHIQAGTTNRDPVRITVNIRSFLSQLAAMDRGLEDARNWFANHTGSVLQVYYEDLFDAETLECNISAFDAIAEFIGLTPSLQWQSPFKKIGTLPLRDVVENFEELRQELMPTKFADMLSD